MADIARQVGRKYVEVSWAVEAGQQLRGFVPDADLRERINRADLLIAGSGAAEPWAVGESSSLLTSNRVLRLDAFQAAAGSPTNGFPWLDPDVVRLASLELAGRLAVQRPQHDEYFRRNAAAFVEALDQLKEEYLARLNRLRRRRVLVMSGEFDPLLQRFGIDVTHALAEAVVEDLDDEAFRRLREVAVQEHVTILVARSDSPTGLLDDLSRRTGLSIVALDPYGSSSASSRATYIDLIRHNLDQLLSKLAEK